MAICGDVQHFRRNARRSDALSTNAIDALVGLLFLSLQLLGLIKTEFFPLGDRNQFRVYLDFEAGTDARKTKADLRKLTARLA